ncbi:tol-pal system protein YbgF [Coralloluteibacterium thermophilus]|uniref:Cell division coordinator CpoB n=1 Tax=Coralloluteibacterium thermophilum TaxID=2707049 RepID=A0ABV9NL31_9GAMM
MHVRFLQVAIVAAALVAAAPVSAQRASLADRVAALEQQQARQGSESSFEQVNRMMQLQSELQALRGQVESMQAELEQLRTRSRQQYVDLDARIGRIEGGQLPAGGGADGTLMEPPELGRQGGEGAAAPVSEPVAELRRVGQSVIPGSQLGTDGAAAAPADPATERADYQAAFDALKEGQYADAAARFRSFIERHPQSALIDNANYWLGESYYVTQNYDLALEAFQTLVQRYPDSDKAPGALLKAGYSQLELRQYDAGEATLRRVLEQYPGTPEASLADGRLRGLVLDRQR